MARIRDTNAKSASLKGKIRDFFGSKPKQDEQPPAPVPMISRPSRIGSKKERKSKKNNDENSAPPSAKESRSTGRRRTDSDASQSTLRVRGIKRQGSNDTIKASPSKKTSLGPLRGILTSHNKASSDSVPATHTESRSAKRISFETNHSDKSTPALLKTCTERATSTIAISSTAASTATDFWNGGSSFNPKITTSGASVCSNPIGRCANQSPMSETNSAKDSLSTLVPSSATTGIGRGPKTHRRSNAIAFSFTELDQLEEADEMSGLPKMNDFGRDCRDATPSRLSPQKVFAVETQATTNRRALKRTKSFVMASPTKDSLDDSFDSQFPELKLTTIDHTTVDENSESTNVQGIGEVVRVARMPPPSGGLVTRSSLRLSTPSLTNKLLSRFNVNIIPRRKETTVWDLSPDEVLIWTGILCITDKEFKATGFELRVPVRNIDLEFRSVDDNAKYQFVNGMPSYSEDPTGRPPAEFSVFYSGHSSPRNRLQDEIAEHRGICIESAWRIGPFSKLSTDLDVQPPPGTSYALQFSVPIPARLFTTGRESRYFTVKAKVTMGDYNLQPIPVCSGIQKVLIEHLRREKHMDGRKGLPIARSHAKFASW